MREKVKFTERVPAIVKLDFNDGTSVDGRAGLQYQYTLDDDTRIMYVDPPIRDYILSAGAKAGDTIAITKHGADPRQWEVFKTARPPQQAPPQQHEPRQPSQLPAAAPPEITPASVELVAALKSAIDAAIEAERYAAMQAHPITFTTEDIRTMANSIICRKAGR